MQSLQFYLKHKRILAIDSLLALHAIIPEKIYLKWLFYLNVGYRLNLNHPVTFNEKLQWLKLYDRKKEYTSLVDKYEVKRIVSDIICAEHSIPALVVWDSVEEIDWTSLPNQFVLKTTHGSGGSGVVICRDFSQFNIEEAKRCLQKSLEHSDTYAHYREWPYKNVRRRILSEKCMSDGVKDLKDYKFFCFNGEVKFFKVDFGRFLDHHANYYDTKGQLLPFGEEICLPVPDAPITLPDNLDIMLDFAARISMGHPFLRVDLYDVNNHVYFGEATFFPASGMGRFTPVEADYMIGDFLKLT